MSEEHGPIEVPVRRVLLLTVCSVLQMLLQFVLLTLVAKWFGTSANVDAFNAALVLPVTLATVLASPLPLVLVPEMVRGISADRADQAWRLGSVVLVAYIAVSILLAAVMGRWPQVTAGILFAGFDAETLRSATGYLAMLVWLVPLNGAITVLQAMHHARRRFRLAAWSGVIGVAVPIAWILLQSEPTLGDFARATVLGAVVSVVLLSVPIGAPCLQAWRAGAEKSFPLRRFLFLVAPLVIAGLYSRLDPLVDRVITSYLPTGSVAQLGYAQRLLNAIATFVSSGLSVAIFPQLAGVSTGDDATQHPRLLAVAWRFLAFLVVPFCVAVLIFGRSIVADLFQRGAFSADDTRVVAAILTWMLGMLIAGAFGEIATKSLFARGATRAAAAIAMAGFTIGIGLKLWWAGRYGVQGVAAATSAYYLLNITAFLSLIYFAFGRIAFDGLGAALGRALVAALAAAAAGAIPVLLMTQGGAVVGGIVGLVVYVAVQRAWGNEFLRRNPLAVPANHEVTEAPGVGS